VYWNLIHFLRSEIGSISDFYSGKELNSVSLTMPFAGNRLFFHDLSQQIVIQIIELPIQIGSVHSSNPGYIRSRDPDDTICRNMGWKMPFQYFYCISRINSVIQSHGQVKQFIAQTYAMIIPPVQKNINFKDSFLSLDLMGERYHHSFPLFLTGIFLPFQAGR
jgi:hypothetical protein